MRQLLLVIFLFTFIDISAQFKNVEIDAWLPGDYGLCEPSIAINPNNPKEMVVGAILDRVYYSSKGGQKWKEKTMKSSYGVFGDPCIIADNNGDFYYFHLSDIEGNSWSSEFILDRIVCQKSTNGKKWNKGVSIGLNRPKQQDKEWAVFDPYSGNIYVTWTQFDKYDSYNPTDSTNIMFSISSDRGLTFTEPIRINEIAGDCRDDDQTVEGAVPAVGPNGEIYVAWSMDEKIYFDVSLDGGITWLKEDMIIAYQPEGWNFDIPGISRANGLPITSCDISEGPFKGNIYVNWSDQKNGADDTDIWLVKSSDGGQSWSSPIRVNNDDTKTHQFFTWMTVDQSSGYLYIVYYDRSAYRDNRTDVMLAVSKDGGNTFKNYTISESPFIPEEIAFFGDYNNIDAVDGVIRPVWTRMDDTITSLWIALINQDDLD
ncbi:MAG TPA: glycosyl hydrolase [Cytophagales bacterium]|jgi:hypothetical protein|nr:glycosyl hydrolase [Cytophagales bacterium]